MEHSTEGAVLDKRRLASLALAATGIVYGDIGTSPLYAFQECFAHGLEPKPAEVLGIVSLLIWSIITVVTLKYVLFVMRADNRGEGGILALLALVGQSQKDGRAVGGLVLTLGLFGASLFFGDGIITPAISVLSAMEGMVVAAPSFEAAVVPATLVVLVILFAVQSHGTHKIGILFGPVMVLWFVMLAALGIRSIVVQPQVLWAFNPLYAASFFVHHGIESFFVMGSVVLAVTGGEALYADMGHFGKKPIQWAWFVLVMPALMINYMGQAALLLDDPGKVTNPFFLMVPSWGVIPMVGLATIATVIASQAVISGVFSIGRQAIQLGFSPRLEIRHTSGEEEGQIYIPRANWALLIGVICLVVGFRSSSNLAAAYGIAVTGTMATTTVLALIVARRMWGWNKALVIAVGAFFLTIDLTFFGANVLKIPNGGWFPLVVGCLVFTVMITWRDGRRLLLSRLAEQSLPLDLFLDRQKESPTKRVAGTAIFLTGNRDSVPLALLHNIKHNKVLHERVVLMTVVTEPIPHVHARDRVVIEGLAQNFYRLEVHYGFFQEPDIPLVLKLCRALGLEFDLMQTSFYLGRETLLPSSQPTLSPWREKLFMMMSRNAVAATDFFRIPAGRVVELGAQVQL